jgi:hypothetical protein
MLRVVIAYIGCVGLFIYSIADYVGYMNEPEKEPDVPVEISLEGFAGSEEISSGDYLVMPNVQPFWLDSLVEETELNTGTTYVSEIIVPLATEAQYKQLFRSFLTGEPDYSDITLFMSTRQEKHKTILENEDNMFSDETLEGEEIRGYLKSSNWFLQEAARQIYGLGTDENMQKLYPGLDVEKVQLITYGELRDYSKGDYDFTLMIVTGIISLIGAVVVLSLSKKAKKPQTAPPENQDLSTMSKW